MTEYVKSTNFASKDSLAIGNPLKIVKGTELDAEFNNIATAVATKADLASPALTGTPVAPTAALGTNTTQLATTAFVLQHLYPIGSVYINAGVSTNPATLFGFGTWVAFGAGKVLVGQDAGDALFDTLEETGGSKDSIVVAHTHTGNTDGVGDHAHSFYADNYDLFDGLNFGSNNAFQTAPGWQTTAGAGAHSHSFTTNSTGSSGTNANLQPYVVVKMWKRVS